MKMNRITKYFATIIMIICIEKVNAQFINKKYLFGATIGQNPNGHSLGRVLNWEVSAGKIFHYKNPHNAIICGIASGLENYNTNSINTDLGATISDSNIVSSIPFRFNVIPIIFLF
jgi:hypothetical protein